MHEVARTNGRVSALTLEELVAIDEASDAESALYAPRKPRHKWGPGLGHLKALFATPRMVRLTILTWLVYCADYWCVGYGLCAEGDELTRAD